MKTLILALCAASQVAAAQSLESRIAAAKGSRIGFDFTTRRNVCGNGMNIRISNDSSSGWTTRTVRSGMIIGRTVSGDQSICEEGPGHVLLTRTDGRVTGVVVSVGGRPERPDTQLGAIGAPEAARYLLSIAPSLEGWSGDNAITGAAIADSTNNWRRMLEIARDNNASEPARKTSLFWVSQEATVVATAGLSDVANDDRANMAVRKDALFFLSQRPGGGGVPALIKVVRESKSAALRKEAIWHLSQSRDPRAMDLFEQLLAGR
ncbi:MAG: lyase domain protein repeat-containing protein [Gemmatimonadetes bacterium]|nr:lyase domain protein repeat-containing protein [Gemmatimonadota bacterium]